MKAILEKEDWTKAGPQYLGDDGVPITFKLYYGQRLQGPTKDSKKVDRAVCECGKVLKPNEGSLWSHLFAKHCVPEVMWKIWDVEYKVRREESPEPEETPKPVGSQRAETPKPAKSRAPTPATRAKPAESRPEPVVLKAADRPEGRRKEETHEDVDYGSSSDISVVRGRRNTTPSPRADTESEKEEVEVEPEVNRPDREDRPKRSEMTAEEKARDNYLSREAKRKRKAESAKAKGYTRRGGNIRVIQFDGWVQASGLEADDDPPELDDGPQIFDPEELRPEGMPQAPEAEEAQPGVVPPEARAEEEEEPAAGGAADRPVDLGPTSKVKDLKNRLKELNAPVWGSKEILWERLKEYEARLRTSREIAEELKRREEAINRDPESARIPADLPVPTQPSEVERELHNLTHLPFASWCEVCLRSRTRDNPHRTMPKEEEATRLAGPTLPLVSMDWFEIKGSPTDEQPEGEAEHGFVQCLLVTDAQTGYVAAIPVPAKKNQSEYACEMVVKFLKLMRHTRFRLRADNEPSLNMVVEAIRGVWQQTLDPSGSDATLLLSLQRKG